MLLDHPITRARYLTDLGDNHHTVGDVLDARRAWRDALQICDDWHHPHAEDLCASLDQGTGP